MLFGHQTDDVTQPAAAPQSGVNPLAVDPATGASLPAAPVVSQPDDSEPSILNQAPTVTPSTNESTSFTAPSSPVPDLAPQAIDTPSPAPEITTPTFSPESADTSLENTPEELAPTSLEPVSPTPVSSDDLLSLKQQALAELSPLVGHLDQTPEEKFRTTMMMIQSTDNHTLIKDAYDAAQQISDEKARAQALLDVINEINYFTQTKSAE